MKLRYLLLAVALIPSLAFAQNAPSGSPRVQGVPDGYGDPVQVTIVGANGADTSPTVTLVPAATASAGVAGTATTAAASNLVGKASAGNLYSYSITTGATAGYLMIFNATSAPVDGAVTPARCLPVAANTGLAVQFATPIYFSTGVTFVFSTTGCFTKTASATAFIVGDVK